MHAGLAAPQGDRKTGNAQPLLGARHTAPPCRSVNPDNQKEKAMPHCTCKNTNVYNGPVPDLELTFGWERYPDKPRVRPWSIREYLTNHPDHLVQFIRLYEKLPGNNSYYRFVFGYRTFDPRCPDNWRPAVFEVAQCANLFGDIASAWEKAVGDPRKENKLALALFNQEAKRRPEAAEALRNLVLPDTSLLHPKKQVCFKPLPSPK